MKTSTIFASLAVIVNLAGGAYSQEQAFGPELPPADTVPHGIAMDCWQNQLLSELPVGESFECPDTGRVYTREAWPRFASYTETIYRGDYGKVGLTNPQFFIFDIDDREVPAFDTSLGTLAVVGFLASGEGYRYYEFENEDTADEDSGCMASGCDSTFQYAELALIVGDLNCTPTNVGAATISGPKFSFTLRQYDGTTDYAGLSGKTKTSTNNSSGNVDEYTEQCMLDAFSDADGSGNVKDGPFGFIVSAYSARTYTNNDLNDADIDWNLDVEVRDAELDVVYTY